jgi:hypothetical protein
VIDTISDQLIESYTSMFYGYGNYAAPFWFIGIEEGGGGTDDEIRRRLLT